MKQLLKICLLLALLSILVMMLFVAIPWQNLPSKDFSVVTTFFLNGLIWGTLLFYELTKRPYSLLIFHWFFCFLLFFLAAFSQYMYGSFPWTISASDNTLLQTNFILLFWTIFVYLGYKITFSKQRNIQAQQESSFQIPGWLVSILTGFTLANTMYRVATIGFSALLARATARVSYGVGVSAGALIVEHTLQALSFFAAVFAFVSYKQKRKGLLWVGIAFVCLLISYFPTALSRTVATAIYGGLALIMFKSLRRNRVVILTLMMGFLIVLPFLNAFRTVSFADVSILDTLQRVFGHLSDAWLGGDYDAYAMLVLILEHVKHFGITWGFQFLGVILFWVPRSLWLSKPIGTGALVSRYLGWEFTNVSAPLPAEGLINAGWGVFLFAGFVGWIMKKLDEAYWNYLDRSGKVMHKYDLLYPILIMFAFFINRGDLLSSISFTMAYVVVWWGLCACCKKVEL